MHHLKQKWAYLFLSTLCLLAVGRCGGGGEVASSTTFNGTLAGNGGQTGTITVTVQSTVASSSLFSIIRRAEAQSTVSASGECVFVGQPPVSLSGTFTPSTGALSLTGDGTTFTGTASGGQMSGTFSNPTTGLSGGFSGLSGTVTTYCGTYQHAPECPTGDSGTFNVQIDSAGNLSGTTQVTSGSGSPVSLSGTVTGNTFSGTSNQGNAFSGTISADGNSVSGTFEQTCPPNTGMGTFSGCVDACTTGTCP